MKFSKSIGNNSSVAIEDIVPTLVKSTLSSELPVDIEQRVNIVYFKIIIVLIER
jgi:hypothetical protein